jgi:SAM-dependent methyltransferase
MDTAYAFHHADHAATQLAYLQECLDANSIDQLFDLGVSAGWQCWEVGAGAGSIAMWLADVVGPTGLVLATDLHPQRIAGHHHVTAAHHNLVTDPLPPQPFDLIHARLLLQHLPQRVELVAKLASCLKPGGWLLLEDFDCRTPPPVLATPNPMAAQLFSTVVGGILEVLANAGVDLGWGVHTYQAMTDAGLVDLACAVHSRSWTGGTPGVLLHEVNSRQKAEQLQLRGITAEELTGFAALAADPGFAARFYLMHSTRGRRPA